MLLKIGNPHNETDSGRQPTIWSIIALPLLFGGSSNESGTVVAVMTAAVAGGLTSTMQTHSFSFLLTGVSLADWLLRRRYYRRPE